MGQPHRQPACEREQPLLGRLLVGGFHLLGLLSAHIRLAHDHVSRDLDPNWRLAERAETAQED